MSSKTRAVALGTLVLALVFAAATSPYFLFGADSARYVALARSLAHGQGYTEFGQSEVSFPPGVPLLLAPVPLILTDGFGAIARWAAFLGALVLPAAWAFGRTRSLAVPLSLLTVFSAGFLEIITGNPRSEPLYMVGSFALLAWAHTASERSDFRHPRLFLAAGALWLLLTMTTRTIGVAMVGAAALVVLERMVRPRPMSERTFDELAIPLAGAVVFLVGWFAWTRMAPPPDELPGAGGYLRSLLLLDPHHPDLGRATLGTFLSRMGRNSLAQLTHAGQLLTQLPWLKPRWFSPLVIGTLAGVVYGWWIDFRRPLRLAAWYFAGYSAILLLWPYDEGVRFLVPILPLLWLFVIAGLRAALAAVADGNRRFRVGAVALSLVAAGGAAWSYLRNPAGFSRQDQLSVLVWLGLLVLVTAGWARAGAFIARIPAQRTRALVGAVLVVYVLAGVVRTIPVVRAQQHGAGLSDPTTEALREASGWIEQNTSPDATIQASFPVPLQFASGRRVVLLPRTGSAAGLREAVERVHPSYLLVLRDTEHPYYQPVDSEKFAVLQTVFPGAWREVVQLRGSVIYAFR